MYVTKTGKLFQLVQKTGNPVYVPKRCYVSMGQPQAYATKQHNHATKHKKHFVNDFAWLDLNNFEIIEYEVIEVKRHKHPLAEEVQNV